MAIQLNEERLNESVGIVKGCMNSNVLDVMQNLSAAIMPEAGTNQLVDQAIEDCRKFQNQFNETTKGLRDFITEMGKFWILRNTWISSALELLATGTRAL